MTDRLIDRYDLVILDLDGVVYLDEAPIPGAAEAIGRLHEDGRRVAYATNNASRRAGQVADLLSRIGIPATADEVVTSAEVAAAILAERLPPGSPVLVIGADALRDEIDAVGLVPVARAGDHPAAVVQGYARDVGWEQLAEATVAVRHGARWVATNTDRTLPSPRGPLPGNGALVAALATALDRQPDEVAGKPHPSLFHRAAERIGGRRCLVVGDRLDTDIAGAARSGMDALLVLTGVATARDVFLADREQRPTYVAADLGALFAGADTTTIGSPDGDEARVDGWTVRRDDQVLSLDGAGESGDALRALCAVAWAGQSPVKLAAGSAVAAEALRRLNLADLATD